MTNTITREAAKRFAIRYAAFGQACDRSDDLGMIVWGDMLLETQQETGIEMYNPENVRLIVSLARNRYAAAQAGERMRDIAGGSRY